MGGTAEVGGEAIGWSACGVDFAGRLVGKERIDGLPKDHRMKF